MNHAERAPGEGQENWKAPKKPETTVGDAEARAADAVPAMDRESDEARSRREASSIDKARQTAMHGGIGRLGIPVNRDRVDHIAPEVQTERGSNAPLDLRQAWDSFSDSDARFDALKSAGVPDKANEKINSPEDLLAWSKEKKGFFAFFKDAFSQNPASPEQALDLFVKQNINKDNSQGFVSEEGRDVMKHAADQAKANVSANADTSGSGGVNQGPKF